jgi:hypothetical protein
VIRLTTHATEMMAERGILHDWVVETVNHPDYRTADPRDVQLTRSFRKILSAQGRMLRVVHRPDGADTLVITAHFDRGARR